MQFFRPGISVFSGTKVGYISKETKSMWSAEYEYLNGYMQRTLIIPKENDEIEIQVYTEEGTFSIKIKDEKGNIIFEIRLPQSH